MIIRENNFHSVATGGHNHLSHSQAQLITMTGEEEAAGQVGPLRMTHRLNLEERREERVDKAMASRLDAPLIPRVRRGGA